MRVLAIRHHGVDSAGFIGAAFEARGAELAVHLLPDDGPLPAPGVFDHVVVLGAESSVNDSHSWIAEELAWLRTVDAAGLPVLGICFGAQAICAAFGGQVETMARQEIGWTLVDSVDHELVPVGPWLEFHGDRCLLPAAATEIARNDTGVQAFRLGRHPARARPQPVPGRHHPRGARRRAARRPPGRRRPTAGKFAPLTTAPH